MGYGVNLSTAGLNPWSYSLFPGVAGANVTYPSDSASVWNDTNLFRFDSDANRLLYGSTALCQQVIPAMNDWYARVAETFQKIMMSIQSGNSTINVNNNNTNIDPSTGKLKEGQIIKELNKMGAGASTKDRMAVEVTFKDKDGNEKKTTLLRRLISLTKEYQEHPDNCELSKENYDKIWDIAGKYAKTGDLSTEDYKTLLEIAKNPGASTTEESSDTEDETDKTETPFTDERKAKTQGETGAVFKQGVDAAVDGYRNGLIGWGTDYTQLDAGQAALNSDNVIEVWDQYYKQVGVNHGETLVDSLYNDFDDWTDGIFTTGGASRFTAIADALLERANNLIDKYGDKSGLTQADIDKFKSDFDSINDDNYDSKKQFISDTFKNFVAKIKQAEAQLVKNEKEQSKK
ncbi:MAG: hypothetical protein KHX03_02025 [Clostridium sp.]|nr:hypothetical protein [Clostridium sp.]